MSAGRLTIIRKKVAFVFVNVLELILAAGTLLVWLIVANNVNHGTNCADDKGKGEKHFDLG